jgi:hypothetical protein
MTRAALFDAMRPYAPDQRIPANDVAVIDGIADRWGLEPITPRTRALAKPDAFFASIRARLFAGKLSPSQVDGINAKLKAMGEAGWPVAYAAYGMATPYWETAKTMQPVREGFYLPAAKQEAFRRSLRYYPWYGRGDVQLTWKANYERADNELLLNGTLVENPDRALEPAISADVLVHGMAEGWFTGKKLSDYLPATGLASRAQFEEARRIINGTDKKAEVATAALAWQDAFADGEWA